jgi:hypothetical protein
MVMPSIFSRAAKALTILAVDQRQIEMFCDQIDRWQPTERQRWLTAKAESPSFSIVGGQTEKATERQKQIFGKAALVLNKVRRTNISKTVNLLREEAEKLGTMRRDSEKDKRRWREAYHIWRRKRNRMFHDICLQTQKIAVLETDQFTVRSLRGKTKVEMTIPNPLFEIPEVRKTEAKAIVRLTLRGTFTAFGLRLLRRKLTFACIAVGPIPAFRTRAGARQLEMPSFLIAK